MTAGGISMYQSSSSSCQGIDLEHYGPIVKRIAYYLLAKLPASVQLDDLIQSGMVGLLEAAEKFDPDKGASFETYASIRIRGAMVDEMRRGDWTPRSVHKNAREVTQTIHQLSASLGRQPTDKEIAQAMSIELDDYYDMIKDAAVGQLASLEETFVDNDFTSDLHADQQHTPHDESNKAAFRKALIDAISDLPEKERLVIALYYDEELNLKEIGEVLGVSESRVSQIHSQATLRLRAKLESWGHR